MLRFFLAAIVFAGYALAQCGASAKFIDPSSIPSWNGWGRDDGNGRFQPAEGAQIPAAAVSKLKLKWAFGFAGTNILSGPASVVGGRVFVGTNNGMVYSLNADSGCLAWFYKAQGGVRTAITVARVSPQLYAAYFGDGRGNVYAVDAATGQLLWKARVDPFPTARITGSPKVFEGRVYVPVSSGEEGAGLNPTYPCCTFRGSVVALDGATGQQIWKTYTIAEEPKQVGKNSDGVLRWAPAGGAVWSSPTIDAKRRLLYVGTGDAYTAPAPATTDSILAMELDSGKVAWQIQDTPNDAWLLGCDGDKRPENCPDEMGPDYDFGASPILTTLPNGRDILIAGQKSGIVWAHDPDRKGALLWKAPLVEKSPPSVGEIVWGGAADGKNAYFGLVSGGVAAVGLEDGARKWFAALKAAEGSTPGEYGPVAAIPGVVFAGGRDGVLRALDATDGHELWEYNTAREYKTVNGIAGKGGSMGAPGPVVAGGTVYVVSGIPGGNVLLAFDLDHQ